MKSNIESIKKATLFLKECGVKQQPVAIAKLCCVTEKTVRNYKKKVDEWYKSDERISPVDYEEYRSKYVTILLKDITKNTYGEKYTQAIGFLVVCKLLERSILCIKFTTLDDITKIGISIVTLYDKIRRMKSHKRFIHSKDKDAKRLLAIGVREVEKLFTRSEGYTVGEESKVWSVNECLMTIMHEADGEISEKKDENIPLDTNQHTIEGLKEHVVYPGYCLLDNNHTVIQPLGIPNELQRKETVTPVSTTGHPHMLPEKPESDENLYGYENYEPSIYYSTPEHKHIIAIPRTELKQLGRDVQTMFNKITLFPRYDAQFIPIEHNASTNEDWGRSYNIFCQIPSEVRLKLGYISYDMSAAMQSISLQLLCATEKEYPLLWNYTNNKKFKKNLRKEISEDTGMPIDKVKSLLTAYANWYNKFIDRHRKLRQFYEESQKLAQSVLKYVQEHDMEVYRRAEEQSRKCQPGEIATLLDCENHSQGNMSKISSVFFFTWTWYERKIRMAMLSVLSDGIELHDAVYSKFDVSEDIVQEEIYQHTGFRIIIDKERLEA